MTILNCEFLYRLSFGMFSGRGLAYSLLCSAKSFSCCTHRARNRSTRRVGSGKSNARASPPLGFGMCRTPVSRLTSDYFISMADVFLRPVQSKRVHKSRRAVDSIAVIRVLSLGPVPTGAEAPHHVVGGGPAVEGLAAPPFVGLVPATGDLGG